MTIGEMRDRVRAIREGFEDEVLRCMDENRYEMVLDVREQLYSGVDGEDKPLSPSYSADPWFREPRAGFFDEDSGRWVSCFMRPELYVEWKRRITPPEPGQRTGLPARQADQPNLFIVGTFHGSIDAKATSKGVEIFTFGWYEGPAVERKYGSQIFGLGTAATGHFNETFLLPWLRRWLEGL